MSKVLFITVGTTALTARALGAVEDHKFRPLRLKAESFLKQNETGKKILATERFMADLVEAHSLHIPGRGYLQQPYRTSAEMTSTYWLLEDVCDFPGPFRHDRGDKLVLLASDTPEGQLCADVNATLMRRFFLHCECRGSMCEAVKAHIIEGLEAAQPKEGPMEVRQNIAKIMHSYDGLSRHFNITGGFKGAVPAIADLCASEFHPCPLFYQHESSASAVRIDLPSRPVASGPAEQQVPQYRLVRSHRG